MATLKESAIATTARDSSSSATNPPDQLAVDLLKAGRLPSLVTAFLKGRDLDLLDPVRFDPAAGRNLQHLGASPGVDRTELAAALRRRNEEYGHPAAAELAKKLSSPGTRVVISGQQPGVFGGPLYTLSKAVAAQLWAEHLESQGHPAVALFWMATEDHDFKESAEVAFFGKNGPFAVSLGEDRQPLVPVGLRRLGPETERVFEELAESIPGERFAEWIDALKTWYRPDASFGDAFAGLLTRLMGARTPLLIDALLPELKQAQVPLFHAMVERRFELAEAFAARDGEVEERGHSLQIRPQEGASPLFVLHQDERRRVVWQSDDRVGLRGVDAFEQPIEWLVDLIGSEPERVSPGARARVAIQDALFGTDLLVLGPGELSYLPQASPLYRLLEISPPTVVLRPQALILEGHQIDKLSKSGLSLEKLTSQGLDMDRALADRESTDFLRVAAGQLEEFLDGLLPAAREIDPNLEKPWGKTRDQMQRALQAFSGKVEAASSRSDAIARQRTEALYQHCLPLGVGQERVISSAHYPGKYGDRFVEAMWEQLDLDPRYLRVIQP